LSDRELVQLALLAILKDLLVAGLDPSRSGLVGHPSAHLAIERTPQGLLLGNRVLLNVTVEVLEPRH
jgi:hypothetical protein